MVNTWNKLTVDVAKIPSIGFFKLWFHLLLLVILPRMDLKKTVDVKMEFGYHFYTSSSQEGWSRLTSRVAGRSLPSRRPHHQKMVGIRGVMDMASLDMLAWSWHAVLVSVERFLDPTLGIFLSQRVIAPMIFKATQLLDSTPIPIVTFSSPLQPALRALHYIIPWSSSRSYDGPGTNTKLEQSSIFWNLIFYVFTVKRVQVSKPKMH